jgi:hypothetical protein
MAEPFLTETPELEAKAIFEHLLSRLPDEQRKTASRALRTFQRRVEEWRRRHGPPKEVFFPQATRPGEWMQVDWTHADELGVTIAVDRKSYLFINGSELDFEKTMVKTGFVFRNPLSNRSCSCGDSFTL